MIKQKLIYRLKVGQPGYEYSKVMGADLHIKFRIDPEFEPEKKQLIKKRLDYSKNFNKIEWPLTKLTDLSRLGHPSGEHLDEIATIKEYLESDGFSNYKDCKNHFLKKTIYGDIAELKIKKPFLTDGLDFHIHFTYLNSPKSLEEVKVICPENLDLFLNSGSYYPKRYESLGEASKKLNRSVKCA